MQVAIPACCNVQKESLRVPSSTKLIFWYSGWGLTFLSFLSFLRRRAPWGQFRFKGGGVGGVEEMAHGGRSECEPLALCSLPSLRCCQGKKAWLWIPHWDGLAPGGMRANLQPCSPTWEQLQPPSASPSWRLPEESVCHPFISEGEAGFLCCDRHAFFFFFLFYEFTKQPPPKPSPLYAPVLECACITFLLIFTLTPRRR